MGTLDKLSIGKRIQQQRELMGYTREELAEMADITPRFCYYLELGQKGMSLETLCKLKSALHINTDYLLFGEQKSFNDSDSVKTLIETCPSDKLTYLIDIITSYLKAVN